MATKSICKDITIKDKTLALGFIEALENAKDKKAKEVVLSKKHRQLSKEDISNIFWEK